MTPRPASLWRPFEAGYRDLILATGVAETGALDPRAAFAAALAVAPNGLHVGFQVATRVGSGSLTVNTETLGSFCPQTALTADISRVATSVSVAAAGSLTGVTLGSAALLGNELVRIDAINAAANTVTLARGCADTVPQLHTAGEVLWCYDANQDYAFDAVERTAGMAVTVAALPQTAGGNTLAIGSAPTATLTLADRPGRPYPPANARLGGALWPTTLAPANLTVAWAHRDRAGQADTLLGWTQGSTGPEPGTTYTLTLYGGNDAGTLAVRKTETGLTGTSYTWSDEDADPATSGTQRWPCVRVTLESLRDGLASWQKFDWTFTRA